MAVAGQLDPQRRRSGRLLLLLLLLLLQGVMGRGIDAVTAVAVAVAGRMGSIGGLEQSQDQVAGESGPGFGFRVGIGAPFVPDLHQRRDTDVQQEILQPETVTGQQHREQNRQIVVDRIILYIDLGEDVDVGGGRIAQSGEDAQPFGGEGRTAGSQFGAEEGDVVEPVVVHFVADSHHHVAHKTVAQLGRFRQLAQNLDLKSSINQVRIADIRQMSY